MTTLFGNTNAPSKSDTDSIEARITAIRFRADDSDFIIAQAVPTNGGKKFTVKGEIADAAVGQAYEFEGPVSFNEQFRTDEMRVVAYRTLLPSDTHGIQRYLVDTAKWVGIPIAKALTDAFGTDTLQVIKKDPARVAAAIHGITPKRAVEMQRSMLDNEANEKATVELHQMIGGSLPKSATSKAIKKWGSKAATVVKRNPFRLTELSGVGFQGADSVWRSIGKPASHPRRKCAAIVHVMNEIHQQTGDTVIDERQISAKAGRLAGGVEPINFEQLEFVGVIVKRSSGFLAQSWALAHIAHAEEKVASRFIAAKPPVENPPIVVDTTGMAADQIEAARMFEKCPIMVLTGAPGTGKTWTTARLIQAVRNRGELALAAPTGKAAKQMSNALAPLGGGNAVTIHSLLKPQFDDESGEFSFQHGPSDPLDAVVVIIDETSMVDIRLANQLLRALRNGTRLLFVGDRHQLPSVGPGSFLRDMIAAGIPSFELTEIKRNAGQIVRACHAIKDGRTPSPSPRLDLETGENWRHIEESNPAMVMRIIEQLYREKIPEFGAQIQRPVNMLWDVQAISPMNTRGSLSCKALNEVIQPVLNMGRTIEDKLDFCENDKVVRLKNGRVRGEYLNEADAPDGDACEAGEVMIVNGDIGVVEEITKGRITVKFLNPDRRVELNRKSHELRLAYCMTVHKLQGSEAPFVVMPLHSQFANTPLWNRQLVYTAFSRAKVALITVGQLATLGAAVSRNGNDKRKTMLTELLRGRMIQYGSN